jgi:predicted amidohydrolase
VFDLGVSGFKAGILTCADSWNPALVYTLALTGCQLILQPVSSALNAVNGDYDNPRGWQINLSHTAMTWGTFVVMVNRVAKDQNLAFYGNSSVFDPYGNSLIKLDSEEQLAVVDIDLEEIKKARFNLPTLRDAQLDLVSRHIKQYTL